MPRPRAFESPAVLPGLEEIRILVARFAEHRDRYVSPDYKEARLRQEFLDPFFAALGWDLGNKKNYSETFKEVVIEEALNVAGSVRSPDYTFRVGGQAVFYAEAKKPAVNLKTDREPAFQLRRYAWTKKLSLSILTDFDEFVVYDTRTRPSPKDKASTARLLYLTCADFECRWKELVDLLSPEAIRRGALDRYEKRTKVKGIELVDEAFLADIEHWREILAKDIARHNSLSQRSLNFAVQQTLDRIVFLRMCEDRGIEPFGRLLELSARKGVYAALALLFRDADNRYNSGLFHFRRERHQYEEPDNFTLSLEISDKVLNEIIAHWPAAGSVDTWLSYMFLRPSVLLEVDWAQIAQG